MVGTRHTTAQASVTLMSMLVLFLASFTARASDTTPIYHLYGEGDHEMSADIQNWQVKDYWLFYNAPSTAPGAVQPIYHCSRYIWFWGTEHFVSKSAGCDGEDYVESLGYLLTSDPGDGHHVLLKECKDGNDHFVSTDANCEGHSFRENLGWASVQFDHGVEKAALTQHPVVFIHGLAGQPSNFADSAGVSVDDLSCDPLCNPFVQQGQRIYIAQVNAANDSEQRGDELFEGILAYMQSPASGYARKVSIVGHSMGGLDMRKAAHRLKAMSINGSPAGENKVAVMISLQSPHRGTPVAKRVLDMYFWTTDNLFCKVSGVCSDYFSDVIADFGDAFLDYAPLYGEDKDLTNVLMQLSYDDYNPDDGYTTGMKHFNTLYPADPVAGYVASFAGGQDDLSNRATVVTAMHTGLGWVGTSFDGDGYCVDDCDGDGAAGQGDGVRDDQDDDGLVPMNSTQIGTRLQYLVDDCVEPCQDNLDRVTEVTTIPYVSDINHPPSAAMTSHDGVMYADHFDVINSSFSPQDQGFDEHEFYSSIIDFIAVKEPLLPPTAPEPVYGNLTGADDDGDGDSIYLDRQDVSCGSHAIKQFRLDRPTFGKINYRYTCQDIGDASATAYNTPNNSAGYPGYSTIFLDRHAIDCSGRAIQKFRLRRPSSTEINYRYRCGNQTLVNITDHYTPEAFDGDGENVYLDRHDVSCPGNKVLTYFRLQRPSGSTFSYHYKCGE